MATNSIVGSLWVHKQSKQFDQLLILDIEEKADFSRSVIRSLRVYTYFSGEISIIYNDTLNLRMLMNDYEELNV